MPSPKSSVWGIDIGQCALKAIRLTYDSKADRAVAQAFDYIEHAKILSQPDADPDELIRAALDKFVSRNDVSGCEVYISVPGQAGLSRFVKLPPVEPKKVPDIVNFEARQQIPFSLDDVVWDYQRIGGGDASDGGDSVELDVGIFAIKKDTVRRHLEPFEAKNIDVHVVQLAPVALYNFAAYDVIYHAGGASQEGEGAEEEEEEGDTIVVLDIGADKTDVVITDGDSIWLRNLPIGGNHFTRALTKELKLTFAKAEHLKRNATKAPDPKKLYQAMRPVFQDFVSELQRSIGFFGSTHRGSVIRKVVGVGNGFKLPGLQKFLQQNLQYRIDKVSRFQGLTGEEILSAPAFNENIMSFCVAYGLALQGLHQTPIQTNLLPNEIRTARLIRDKKPWSLAAAAAVLLGFASVFASNYFVLRTVNGESFETAMRGAQQSANEFSGYKRDFDQAKSQYQAANDRGQALIGLTRIEDRDMWLKAMQLVSQALPPRSDVDLRNISSMAEVNVDILRATYLPNLGEWFSGLDRNKARLETMLKQDQEAPPAGAGWVFQLKGHTYNADEFAFLTREVVRRFQSDEMRKNGFSHAVLAEYQTKSDWTPSSGALITQVKELGPRKRGGGSGGVYGASRGFVNPNLTKGTAEERFAGLPADMREYMKSSEERNKQEGSSNKITRTDFVIEFCWRPEAMRQGEAGAPAAGSTPAPAGPIFFQGQ